MNKYLLILVISASLISCRTKELEEQVQLLQQENEELLAKTLGQDTTLAEYMEVFNEIGTNLSEIRARESSIELNSSERAVDSKERVREDIQIINDLMAQNRAKIEELDKKLKGAWGANNRLKKAMEQLKADFAVQIASKDSAIAQLKDQLQRMDFTVQELNSTVANLSTSNAEKDAALAQREQQLTEQITVRNTAFYTVGSQKQLVADKVITKEGGVLGMGKTSTLSGSMDESKFNRIDIREIKSIQVNAKKATLATTHPAGSYRFESDGGKGISNLVILDSEKFWNSSKYLVVVTD